MSKEHPVPTPAENFLERGLYGLGGALGVRMNWAQMQDKSLLRQVFLEEKAGEGKLRFLGSKDTPDFLNKTLREFEISSTTNPVFNRLAIAMSTSYDQERVAENIRPYIFSRRGLARGLQIQYEVACGCVVTDEEAAARILSDQTQYEEFIDIHLNNPNQTLDSLYTRGVEGPLLVTAHLRKDKTLDFYFNQVLYLEKEEDLDQAFKHFQEFEKTLPKPDQVITPQEFAKLALNYISSDPLKR